MLLSPNPKIEEMLVAVLAERPNVTAKEVHERICAHYGQVSIQAVYQELKKLERNGVIFRHKRRYRLGLHWVLELASFADAVYDRYTEADVLGPLPEPNSPPVRWTFHSIAAVVPFWTHLVLCMAQASKERICYEYMDHIWFHLCSSTVETKLLKAVKQLGVRHSIAVGGDTYLDRLYLEDVETQPPALRFGSSVFPPGKEQYLSCIGPYVLRIKPKKEFLPVIEAFYGSVSARRPLSAGTAAAFVSQRSRFTMTLEHNPAKAARIKRSFERFFGDVEPQNSRAKPR